MPAAKNTFEVLLLINKLINNLKEVFEFGNEWKLFLNPGLKCGHIKTKIAD